MIRIGDFRKRRRRIAHLRRGQALVEFALISLVVYLLLAAVLTFGHVLFIAQTAQQTVDLAAREISRLPLPANEYAMEDVLYGSVGENPELETVRTEIFDEHYLVLNLDTLHGHSSLADLVADLPVANQQLVPLMISDAIGNSRVLRYPGDVIADNDDSDDPIAPPPSGYLVRIPIVKSDGNVEYVPLFEEIDSDVDAVRADPFLLSSDQRGLVALRLNYPYQSTTMSRSLNTASGEVVLGQPYRRLVSTQAIYRREIFLP